MTATAGLTRRIFGIETEFGITCSDDGQRTLTPDEVARHLFRPVVRFGRSSNVFLTNGARLYLDVGSHPEYATAECDDPRQVLVQDRAGEAIVADLARQAQAGLREAGVAGTIYVFKNNVDANGNSYGCHENYLVGRETDFAGAADALLPFLVTRQLVCGAGRVVRGPRGATYALSQRADQVWEGVSSATTRSRPIINTRDEPHADPEHHRRLHVIVGDSNMAEPTTLLKVGACHLVLHMIESGIEMPELALANPIRAIRAFSTDATGRTTAERAGGGTITALDVQRALCERATAHAAEHGMDDPTTASVLDLWTRAVRAVDEDRPELVDTEIDWVVKRRLLDTYATRHGLDLDSPRIAQLDLAYHDIDPDRGVFRLLERAGRARRITDPPEIADATGIPPQTTRARLRGDFVRAAREHDRDFTVDWVHLKLNDAGQRTVLCKDPFRSHDDRVDRLLEEASRPASRPPTP